MPITSYVPSSAIAKPGICTSSTRPASPYQGQAIYETDTNKLLIWNGTAWNPPSNMPWGLVTTTSGGTNNLGYVKGMASQTVTAGNTADVTNSSMTFTGVAGRLYRYSTSAYTASTSTAGLATLAVTDASNNILWVAYSNITNSSGGGWIGCSYIFTATGSTTVKLRWQAITGNCSIFSTHSGYGVTLEDIGPA
jgi:hypothetical protein